MWSSPTIHLHFYLQEQDNALPLFFKTHKSSHLSIFFSSNEISNGFSVLHEGHGEWWVPGILGSCLISWLADTVGGSIERKNGPLWSGIIMSRCYRTKLLFCCKLIKRLGSQSSSRTGGLKVFPSNETQKLLWKCHYLKNSTPLSTFFSQFLKEMDPIYFLILL